MIKQNKLKQMKILGCVLFVFFISYGYSQTTNNSSSGKVIHDSRDEVTKNFAIQKINTESNGYFKLISFQKTNGYKPQENINNYVIEWEMQIECVKNCWKRPYNQNQSKFLWGDNQRSSFQVLEESEVPKELESAYIMTGSHHYLIGNRAKFIGTASMIEKEKGWEVTDLIVSSAWDKIN